MGPVPYQRRKERYDCDSRHKALVHLIALRGLSKKICDPLLQSMSNGSRGVFIEEMEELGLIRRSDVEAARAAVARLAKLLADEGRFMLPQEGYIY
jgi:flagellar motor switch protein FliG